MDAGFSGKPLKPTVGRTDIEASPAPRAGGSPPTAIAREEMVEHGLQRLVDLHGVGATQVAAAGWAGEHLGTEGAVQAVLADVVLAHGGDGLEHQLLAADAQESLLYFAQE